MKKECDIVEDLLFGYVDNTLKEGSKELVEKHLKTCQNCKEILEDIKKDEDKGTENKEVEGLKKVNKKMKNKKLILFIITTIFSLFVILNVMVFVKYTTYAGRIEVFLDNEMSKEYIEEFKKIVYSVDKESSVIYMSKRMALEEVKNKMILKGENVDLLNGYSDENNPFPPYFIINTKIKYVDKMIEEVSKLDESKKITSFKNINPYVYAIYFVIDFYEKLIN